MPYQLKFRRVSIKLILETYSKSASRAIAIEGFLMCWDPFDFLTDQGRKPRWEGGHAPLPGAPPFFWKNFICEVPTMILMKDLRTF